MKTTRSQKLRLEKGEKLTDASLKGSIGPGKERESCGDGDCQ